MAKSSKDAKKAQPAHQNAGAIIKATPLAPPTEKKGRWTLEECQILTKLSNEGKSYDYIGEKIGRAAKVCRYKWNNRFSAAWYAQLLSPNPDIPSAGSPWSSKEDEICVSLRMEGKGWKEISAKLPGRGFMACEQQFYRKHPELVAERKRRGGEEEKEQDGSSDDGGSEEEEGGVGCQEAARERITDERVIDDEADAEGVEDEGEEWWKKLAPHLSGPSDAAI